MPLLEQLYSEPRPENLRYDLIGDGIKTLEDAYMQGYRHALAELQVRIEEQRHNK